MLLRGCLRIRPSANLETSIGLLRLNFPHIFPHHKLEATAKCLAQTTSERELGLNIVFFPEF